MRRRPSVADCDAAAVKLTWPALGAAALATLLALAPARAVDLTEAMDQVPAKAAAVVIVPSLVELSDAIGGFAADLGLTGPEFQDTLGMFKRQVGMTDGVNDDGTLMIVVLGGEHLAPADDADTTGRPDVLLMMPVTDYATFISSIQGNPNEPVTQFRLPSGHVGFARHQMGYAVLSEHRQVVQDYQPAKQGEALLERASRLGREHLQQADAAIYLDATQIDPQAWSRIAHLSAAPQVPGGTTLDTFMPTCLAQAQTIVQTLNMTDQGVAVAMAIHAKPNSSLAAMVGPGSSQASDVLAKLPDQAFVLAGAIDTDMLDVSQLLSSAAEARPGPLGETLAGMAQLVDQIQSTASALYSPEADAFAGSLLNVLNVYQVADGEAFVESFEQFLRSLAGKQVPVLNGLGQSVAIDVNYVRNAFELEGHQIDQYELRLNIPQTLIDQTPALALLAAPQQGYITTKDNFLLMTSRLDAQILRRGLRAMDQASGIGSTGTISAERSIAMPANAAVEMFISLSGMAEAYNAWASLVGRDALNVPLDLPPVVVGVAVDNRVLATRVYAANRTIRWAAETVRKLRPATGETDAEAAP